MNKPYGCPICHTSYSNEDDALRCLGKCIEQQEGLKYACPYCEEIFEYSWEARKCAAKCWIDDNNIASVRIALKTRVGHCTTCANADENNTRIFPCPHRHDIEPPESCQQYDPDVRHFGTALATEWQQEARS